MSVLRLLNKQAQSNKNLENYSALFIGGGNTFKLLKDLKDSGSFEKIKVFLDKFPDSYIIIGLAVCRHILALIVE